MKLHLEQLVMQALPKAYSGETINAAGVMQVPMLVSVWDDGAWNFCSKKKYQTTKEKYLRKY